ncbi:SRPBCC family protein [Rhizobium sp. KVB221]|uniref:SRPBCC family protein n=1 Tax=Rhizobium setariae TaxID=2801340 RepID=A0A937CLQ7_9HYPH|nr:SRPBCC family protein [Rhizobium setariae]MBL0371931.1 SRPBCC family protein [Rhizobium setariae]
MLNVLLYVLVLALLLLLVLVIFAIRRPNEFSISRAIMIRAPAETVFPLIDDFRQWPSWSPWERLDPAMKRSLSGSPSGSGAVYEWEGNKQVGAGRMEILSTTPSSRVDIKLSFYKPFRAENRTTFSLTPQHGGTQVNWEMSGTNNLMFKIMGILMNMDKMVGRDFERGLAAMKARAETEASLNATPS